MTTKQQLTQQLKDLQVLSDLWENLADKGIINNHSTKQSEATSRIIQIFKDRDKQGFQKFGSSLEASPRNNISDRIQDIIEELCDAIQYLVALQQLIEFHKNNE